jgi:SREBP regulating gene protein
MSFLFAWLTRFNGGAELSNGSYEEAERRIDQVLRHGNDEESHIALLSLHSLQLRHVPPRIGELAPLKVQKLALDRNELAELPDGLWQLTTLTRLSLHRNRFELLSSRVGQLVNLTDLDLYRCSLRRLPDEIGQLRCLVKLWLHHNLLMTLPDTIGHLQALRELRVSNNLLLQVPVSIGRLGALVRLSLASNQLSRVPSSLADLHALTWFTCHDNLWDAEHRFLGSSPWFDEERIRAIQRRLAERGELEEDEHQGAVADVVVERGTAITDLVDWQPQPPPQPPPPKQLARSWSGNFVLMVLLVAAALSLAAAGLWSVYRPAAPSDSAWPPPIEKSDAWWQSFVDVDDRPDLSSPVTSEFATNRRRIVITTTLESGDTERRELNLRDKRGADDESRCENTVQGKLLVTDSLGYTCHRSALDADRPGCCSRRASASAALDSDDDDGRFSCEQCKAHDGGQVDCCSRFETCVSCCMHPRHQEQLERLLDIESTSTSTAAATAAATRRVSSLARTEHRFQVCVALCRTSSHSIVNGKHYFCSKHQHCFHHHRFPSQLVNH